MKEAIGYLADDGTFFENADEATQHDAVVTIDRWCESHKIDPNKVMLIIKSLSSAIRTYIDASETIQARHELQPDQRRAVAKADQADDGDGTDNLSAVLKQPFD
jgi:hypothetical protein